ncbi:hypothetical protein X566_19835 [Afipia sp. P52-10]|nr:hypothetical protein X566_19835 [Afipia sp. P52-10]
MLFLLLPVAGANDSGPSGLVNVGCGTGAVQDQHAAHRHAVQRTQTTGL